MSLHHSFSKGDALAKEYFWGHTLSKDNPTVTWSFTDEEDTEDCDFMDHSLFLKNATLGSSAVHNERNIVQVETTNYESKEVKQPLFSLTSGLRDACSLDISFVGKIPVVFRLIEGSGPLHISGQQLVEFPPEDEGQDDTELLEDGEELDLDDSRIKEKKTQKRKAPPHSPKSKKKGKMEISADSDEESEDVEEEEEDEMDDDEEEPDDDDDDDDDYESPKSKKMKAMKAKKEVVKKGVKKGDKVASKVVKKQVVKKTKK